MAEYPSSFKALVLEKKENKVIPRVKTVHKGSLSKGDVVIKTAYSSLNYKDMLAFKENGGVIKNYPMIPGIDLSGTVVSSTDEGFQEGDKVLATGYGLGVSHSGGFSEYEKVPGYWLIKLPRKLSLKDAMSIGTAGFTAALSVDALINNGMNLDDQIMVTGATGGVGSIAMQILKKLGCSNLSALVHRPESEKLAKKLGASQVVTSDSLGEPKLMANQQYDFVLDAVGGSVAEALIPQIKYDGTITMCGNAAGVNLNTNVLPFILRAVRLIGIDSVQVQLPQRIRIWDLLAGDWNINDKIINNEINLAEVPKVIKQIEKGGHIGRTIVKL